MSTIAFNGSGLSAVFLPETLPHKFLLAKIGQKLFSASSTSSPYILEHLGRTGRGTKQNFNANG